MTFISITPSQTGLKSIGPFQRTGEASPRKKSIEATFTPSGPTGGTAPSGVIVSDRPCMPSIRGTQGPLRSTSNSPTRYPRRASARARLIVVMLLPTPPLPLMTTILCLIPAMRACTCFICSVICWTTFASSVYWSLLRMDFRSFSCAAGIALSSLEQCSRGSTVTQGFLESQTSHQQQVADSEQREEPAKSKADRLSRATSSLLLVPFVSLLIEYWNVG